MITESRKYFALVISIVFFIVGCFTAWHHELWIDEAYHYLLAKESASVPEIVHNARLSGHPVLWNIVLFFYRMMAPGIFEMQVLHCLIAAVCIFLIAYYSPFNKAEIVLIAFGYFFIYEYNVIAKNYILGFTLIFFAIILSEKKRSLWQIALVLGLSANLHLFTLFVSGPLFLYLFIENYSALNKKATIISASLFFLLCMISIIQIIPPQHIIDAYNSHNPSSLLAMPRFKRAFWSFGKGLLNIPDFWRPNFWNSNLIYEQDPFFLHVLTGSLLLAVIFIFRKNIKLLLLFFIPALLIMSFVYMAPLSVGVRYWGYYYVLLIICSWFLKRSQQQGFFSNAFFRSILLIQFITATPVLVLEYKRSFSNSKNAAEAVSPMEIKKHPFFVETLSMGPPLSAYTGKKVFYPSNGTFETFTYWIKAKKYTPVEFVMESLQNLKTMKLDTCIIVLNKEIPDSVSFSLGAFCHTKKICALSGAVLPSEDYFIYLLSRKK